MGTRMGAAGCSRPRVVPGCGARRDGCRERCGEMPGAGHRVLGTGCCPARVRNRSRVSFPIFISKGLSMGMGFGNRETLRCSGKA